VTFLYLAGMFLNDAFDAGFDWNHRRTRPIPSGMIKEKEVWLWGGVWMVLGLAGMTIAGAHTAILGLALCACIVFYNAVHKISGASVVVMGGCRFLVYLCAASVAAEGITGEVIWKGLALGCYVVGLSCLARKETAPVRIQYWPCILLVAPIGVAALFDDAPSQGAASVGSILLVLWVVWTLLQVFGREHPNVGLAVSRLLAGIALVDLLAVADWSHSAMFPAWFLMALLMQRFIPAT
jgi:4-hydroxybenzoate polyprenyltransferase